jgi:hypothetical protein
MSLRTVLLSIQALLAAAEPSDPQDAVVAKQVRLPLAAGLPLSTSSPFLRLSLLSLSLP